MIKGFVLDDERLKQGKTAFDYDEFGNKLHNSSFHPIFFMESSCFLRHARLLKLDNGKEKCNDESGPSAASATGATLLLP